MRTFFLTFSALFIMLLIGCANTPKFDTTGVDATLTPQSVITETETSVGKTALWGGTILNTQNLEKTTQLEMLAYPLNSSNKPMLDSKPLGRFIIRHQGYLEAASYETGKLLTVLGKISQNLKGKVGESEYTYPTINAKQLHLWTANDEPKTSFHLGIGIRL